MRLKAKTKSLPDTYFQLIERFPLAHLRNDTELAVAQRIIDELWETMKVRSGNAVPAEFRTSNPQARAESLAATFM